MFTVRGWWGVSGVPTADSSVSSEKSTCTDYINADGWTAYTQGVNLQANRLTKSSNSFESVNSAAVQWHLRIVTIITVTFPELSQPPQVHQELENSTWKFRKSFTWFESITQRTTVLLLLFLTYAKYRFDDKSLFKLKNNWDNNRSKQTEKLYRWHTKGYICCWCIMSDIKHPLRGHVHGGSVHGLVAA